MAVTSTFPVKVGDKVINTSHEDLVDAVLGPGRETALKGYWVMYYKHGMGSNLTKGFYLAGSRENAVRRASKHCEIMQYKLLLVRPLVCNLDEDEAVKSIAREGEIVP